MQSIRMFEVSERKRRAVRVVAAILTLVLSGVQSARAELLLGLVEATTVTPGRIVTFDSLSPSTVVSSVDISGLQVGDSITGIDIRPATGQLFGLSAFGSASRLYTINPTTGVATLASTIGVRVADNLFGMDFDPVADRLRIVTATATPQNLTINVDTGAVALHTPVVGAAMHASAYTNNFAGATNTTLYGIDAFNGVLAIQNPPNAGVLAAVETISVSGIQRNTSLDISGPTGKAYAKLRGNDLYTVNLATGAVTLVGPIGIRGIGEISGIAAPVGMPVPEPATLPMAITAGLIALRYVWGSVRKKH
jgi:hypothetical protein